jgi:hypothetical protein
LREPVVESIVALPSTVANVNRTWRYLSPDRLHAQTESFRPPVAWKSKRMKIVAKLLLTFVFGVALLEIFGFAAAYILGVSDKTVREMLTGGNTFEVKTSGCTGDYASQMYPHPYLAFVHDPICSQTNNIGLLGQNVPPPGNDFFVVGIFGGSVAAQFAGLSGPTEFERLLNKCYANRKGKKFLVLNFAEGGWKQPQQVIALTLFGKYIDLAVSIEGYNEATYGLLHAGGAVFSAPTSTYTVVNPLLYRGYFARNALATFISHVENNDVLNRSNGLKVLILSGKNLIQKVYGDGAASARTVFVDHWETTVDDELKDYARYLRQFAAIATSEHIDYYFVLQPSAAYKHLTEEERKVVTSTHYKREYDLIDTMFRTYFQERYLSLKDFFQHESRQIFYDNAHMSKSGDLAFGGTAISYGQQKVAQKLAEFLSGKGAIARTACID